VERLIRKGKMHKYIQISLTSANDVTHAQRKAYLSSLYGSVYKRKKGIVFKFCGSIGFKPVLYDPYSEFPILIDPEVDSPNSYIDPEKMLYDALHVNLAKNGIVNFTVPVGIEDHSVAKYSYNREKICQKFAKFLKKVYPNLIVNVFWLDDFETTVTDFVLDYIYRNLDFDDELYTVECSSHRLLTDEEIKGIYKKMAGVTKYGWKIDQFYCETCKKYHPDAPYHIMVVYDKENF
jgi:hypothetical protein